ncbi:protein trapped in endoderm-1-like [Neocloeon triangulifer]|uniref:protein trapped in endoderm-1-like n=1 Tax=Neocloeon triangulifer TaxID=2078957 RepID=UPI00286ECFF8|nr:protein trapped in endoderm-1-like [Neocloeon triangulifer]
MATFGNETEPAVLFYTEDASTVASISATILAVVGVAGNLVTMIALLRCTKLRQHATTAFVVSLCISDLLFCTINLPMTAFRFWNRAWIFGETLCSLFPFFFYGNVAVSLLSMVAITINRYILIACHGLYDRVYSRTSIILQMLFAWAFSFSIMIPPLVGAWGRLGYHEATFSCTILRKEGKSPKKFLFVFGFLLPCIVIILSYGCIFMKVRCSRKKLQAHNPICKNQRSKKEMSQQQMLQKRDDNRLTRMMLTIFLCFLLCFLPLMIVNVADEAIKKPMVHIVASILAWASSVINPFIYAVSNRQYRQAYRALLCPKPRPNCQLGHHRSNNSSKSDSRKTFVTDMLHFNTANEKVKINLHVATDANNQR